ncbi:MAG: sulfurtransferase TusA family protein, partial [Pseudomonadales bacterium]|nr:sulfurtransferase TusA family protein [Pseudomonadales bacterium]
CPLPLIRTQNRISELAPGDELVVHCTDPGVLQDIPSWCRIHGHEVIDTAQEGRDIHITIRIQ